MINQQILCELNKTLSDNKITWGVGGSYLLQLYDLYSNPNDLDLWVKPSDMPTIKSIFKDFEQIHTDIYLPEEYHYKIRYYTTEVEFVACFIVKPNKNRYEYNISPEYINYLKLDDGIEIPCTLLEDWYIIYRLLKRNDKADIIEKFFLNNNIEFSTILTQSEKLAIPKQLKKDVDKLLQVYYSRFQLSFWDLYKEKEICSSK